MSEAKFTPGPWTEHMTEMARHGKNDLFYISAESDGEYIGKVKSKNARLIAKAPEMLALLEESLSAFIHHDEVGIPEKSLIRRIDELIDEVKGGTE